MLPKAGMWLLPTLIWLTGTVAIGQNSFSVAGVASGLFAPDSFNGLNQGSSGFVSAAFQLVSSPPANPSSGAVSVQVSDDSGFLTVSGSDCSDGSGAKNLGLNSTPRTLFACADNSQIQRGYNLGIIIFKDFNGVIPEYRLAVLVVGVPTGEIKTNPPSPIGLSSANLVQPVAVTFNPQNGANNGQATSSDTVQSITIDPQNPDEGQWLRLGGTCVGASLMTSGQISCTLMLTADPTKLDQTAQIGQTYTSDVKIVMTNGDHGDVEVSFNYTHAAAPPLVFTSSSSFNGAATQQFSATITASGGVTPYTFSATGLPAGLNINSTTGVISGTASAGTYMPTVSVKDSAGMSISEQVTISIQAAGLPLAFTSSTTFTGAAGQTFSATITASGGVTPYTFSATGLPPGLTINSATGVISGTVAAGTYQPTVTVKDSTNASKSEQITITIAPAPAVPTINVQGIVNNASFAAGAAPLAPGVIAAIFGTNLTNGSSCLAPHCNPAFDNNGRLNTTLAGAQVTVNGIPAPIFYASPMQIGIQIPAELNGNSAAVQVKVGGQPSLLQPITLASVSPGIFTTTANGKGVGAINHANGSALTAQNPAHPGEVVIIYGTGLGQVQPSVATGELPSTAAVTVVPVTVTIDGVAVTPEFAGLSGCCVGENQINVRIPGETRSGDNIELVLNIAGKQSNSVTISVRP